MGYTTVVGAFRRGLAKAGLAHLRIHDLRHTAATLLLKDGVHPKVVQELLGHSSITLTLDTYSHVVPALHAEVARRCRASSGCRMVALCPVVEEVIEVPYVRQPLEFPARYAHGPDSFPQPGVPRGELHEYEWNSSRVFPGTHRRYWVYVPAQYSDTAPASLMVFQDAQWYLDPEREARASIVFDNLIHRGEMPVTIGVFVAPGEPGRRNIEYDAFDDAYATFLLTEILPAVRDRYAIADEPRRWAIGGGSSGGSCAFTAGWMRSDRFRRVLSFVGSFAQLHGGNHYPQLILETPKKPLRIFLHTVVRDLNWDKPHNNWVSENLRVAAALAERGYDFRFVLGDGTHNGNHDGVILPDALRWLWRPAAE